MPPNDPLLPSLIDRLLDDEPDVSTEPAWSWTQDVRNLKQSVMRDLEALLNTRQTRADLLRDAPDAEVAQSVLTYGLPEVASATPSDPLACEELRRAVQEAIRRFEPRLLDVRVHLREAENASERKLHLVVEGSLDMTPEPVPVVFDTVVEEATRNQPASPSNGVFKVKETM
jgi:type VI secretion system protein ImpF